MFFRVENMDHNWQSLLTEHVSKQRDHFDKKNKRDDAACDNSSKIKQKVIKSYLNLYLKYLDK